ncbi:uncharacterized protein KQ657_000619 [Scheffersomyces spartinae]|uniref:Uncharacterized protein n=1 Tax=Scheffersomyces spartinae TaxID=45513 RepID=A0A9P7V9J9_9ASCO|nr:uncharacterized protein KQ657_000619 [Scheffersomyces spartinae]KAG7193550.1 hypothetical protein KQ657_000619 [Scheffersomyces spartinae]
MSEGSSRLEDPKIKKVKRSQSSSNGKVTCNKFDKSKLQPCPILRPTIKEFSNPIAYLSRPDIAQLGSQFGIVKVVPPVGWQAPFSISKQFKFHTRFQKLSELGIISRSRKFFTDNLNRYLKMHNQPKVRCYINCRNGKRVHYYDLYLAVQKLGVNLEHLNDRHWKSLCQTLEVDVSMAQLLKYEYNSKIKAYSHFLSSCSLDTFIDEDGERPQDFESQNDSDYIRSDDDDDDDDDKVTDDHCVVCHKNDNPARTLLCDNCDDAYHMYCLEPPLKVIPENDWFCKRCLVGDGAYGFEENTDHKYTITEFIDNCVAFEKQFISNHNNNQPLTIDSIEEKFWHFVNLQRSDITVEYGADIHHMKQGEISGFPMAEKGDLMNPLSCSYVDHPFNLTKLLYASGSLLNHIKKTISGMTIPWIYIGSLLLTFCWHVEDHYTLSANYCHFGATKKWYGIPSYHATKFEALMKDCAPDLFQRQPDLLHQLVSLLSPMTLVDHGIDVVYCDQNPNEYVITYPKVYHAGFNCGFNFNEAVNFTMDSWLPFGEDAIKNYKDIRKENVFDHFKLLENILRDCMRHPQQYSTKGEFIQGCLRSFEEYIDTQILLSGNLIKSGVVRERYVKPEQDEANEYSETDDEPTCGVCRTCISYQYCLVDNRLHNFGAVAQLLGRNDQLLTPDNTPKEMIANRDNMGVVTELSSSQRLHEVITSDPYYDLEQGVVKGKLCVMREYDALIESAKRSAEDLEKENARSKRRKSRRLEQRLKESDTTVGARDGATNATSASVAAAGTTDIKLEQVDPPLMSSVRPGNLFRASTLKLLNEHDTFKVCVECLTNLHNDGVINELPVGSKIVEERSLRHIKQLNHTIKTMNIWG